MNRYIEEEAKRCQEAYSKLRPKSKKRRSREAKNRRKRARLTSKSAPLPASCYSSYMRSSRWRARRRQLLASRGHRCERCGTSESLHVHHKSYERLGCEVDADLEVLCEVCHAEEHGKQPPMTSDLDSEFLRLQF